MTSINENKLREEITKLCDEVVSYRKALGIICDHSTDHKLAVAVAWKTLKNGRGIK